jgi:hypothetical protein
MKVSEAFPSKYLKAEDLDGEETVIIDKVVKEEIGEARDLRNVLCFKDGRKMVCNLTNAKRIVLLHGDEMDDWPGKKIVLTTEWVTFKGETVPGLRVKPPGVTTKRKHATKDHGTFQSSTTAPATEGLDDEIPFDPPAAKPDGMSFEEVAEAAASRGYEQLNSLYKAPTTTLEQKRWLSLNKLRLEQLYPRPTTD